MKNISEEMLKISAEFALRAEVPNGLISFSLEYNNINKIFSCLSIFENTPTDEEIDTLSSAIAEIESNFGASILKTSDCYLSIKDNPELNVLKIEVYRKTYIV